MPHNPQISVIIPCFNQAEYLAEALNSVLAQTYTDWECIVINDGSYDHTQQIAESYLDKNARFRYYYQENKGLSAARNQGMELAKGEFILPLDADDKISNQYLEKAINEFRQNKILKLVYCKANFFGSINQSWDIIEYSYPELLLRNIIFCSAMFRKKDVLEIDGYDTAFIYGWEDWDLWVRLLDPNAHVARLDYTGFHYRIKETSMLQGLELSTDRKNFVRRQVLAKSIDKYCEVFGQPYEMLNDLLHGRAFVKKTKNNFLYKAWLPLQNLINRLRK